MITGELKSKIDKIWETFWTGGITNPLEVIEQFTYLLFIKGLDEIETKNEANATLLGVPYEKIFNDEQQHLRWSKFINEGNSEKMYEIVQNEVFPFIKKLHGNKDSAYAKYMDDAIFKIPTPLMLSKIADGINNLDLRNDRDTKGDLYEYLLSKVATAGTNGQFRTPRHIIDMIVNLMKPMPEDIIVDQPLFYKIQYLLGTKHREIAFLNIFKDFKRLDVNLLRSIFMNKIKWISL
jgi:type I restriction enzyme M protein